MRIHQIVIGASPGDAITSAALRARNALRQWVDAEVYGVHVHPALRDEVHDLWDRYPRDGRPDDVLVYHVSIGEPAVVDFVVRSPERFILSYHNITPASWFQSTNPEFASRLRDGRAELRTLVGAAEGAIAASGFNAAELVGLGIDRVETAPPPMDLERLSDVGADTSLVAHLDPSAPLVLTVGQVLPHKRQDLALQAHHFLNVNHLPDAQLVVAGAMRQHVWSSAVVRHSESLRLTSARITGEVSDAQLAALYRRADVLLVPSEHEGFCVPLIEAMTFGVPVVARDFAALAETAGGAALILPPSAGAPELAAALARVLCDDDVADVLRARGRRRSARFEADRTLALWLRALTRLLSPGRGPHGGVG